MSICRRIKRGEQANWSPFCDCCSSIGRQSVLKCSCGEENEGWVEWAWDPGDPGSPVTNPHGTAFIGRGFGRPPSLGSPVLLVSENKQVMFHPSYSSGTAAVRGQHPLEPGMHHYWEVKILTSLYGTDMMVGVGTAAVDLCKDRFKYCSLLGEDNESWGYSYNGNVQHGGKTTNYGFSFGMGSIIGVHVDLWHGKLEFYLNRKPLGVAFTNLHGKTLYPMASSTAAKSGIRLIHASSHPHSLLLSCTRALGKASEAALYNSQPNKRPCVVGSGMTAMWGSAPVTKATVNPVSTLGSISKGTTSAEALLFRNTPKVLDGHSCAALPLSPVNSGRGALCPSNKLGDGSLRKGQLCFMHCDKTPSSHSTSSSSNSENSQLVCKHCESSEPVVEASRAVLPVNKLNQSAHWLSKAASNTERYNIKETHVQFGAGCSQSISTAEVSLPKPKGNSSLEVKPKDTIEPYLLDWLKEDEDETAPKLDFVLCPRKRKRTYNVKETHVQFGAGCSQSISTAEVSLPKPKGNSSLEVKPKDTIEPYLLDWLKEDEDETAPKLDFVLCPRKRKRPPCDFVECIWSIPGLRAKVECSFWWLLGTRRGKGVLVASGDTSPAYPSLVIVDEDEEWGRRVHGEVKRSSQGERIHHQLPEDGVNRQSHERLCLMCHPVI